MKLAKEHNIGAVKTKALMTGQSEKEKQARKIENRSKILENLEIEKYVNVG